MPDRREKGGLPLKKQKELLSLVLHKAILAPDSIKIALYGRPLEIGLLSLCESEIHSQTPICMI